MALFKQSLKIAQLIADKRHFRGLGVALHNEPLDLLAQLSNPFSQLAFLVFRGISPGLEQGALPIHCLSDVLI